MNSPRLILLLALTFASVAPVLADTNVGTPINSLPAFLGSPGKYRLTRNFNFNNNGTAILISGRDVVLDMNGYTINGPADAESDSVCIKITGPNAIVRNGTIRRFHTGIVDEGDSPVGTLLDDLQLLNQHSTGVRLSAGKSLLRRLRISATGSGEEGVDSITGIFLTGSATIENCLIQALETQNGLVLPVGMRLFSDATYVVRECDLVTIPGTAIAYSGDVSGILERIRIRVAAVGLNITGTESPLLRDSTFRKCITTTIGTFEDGERNFLSSN